MQIERHICPDTKAIFIQMPTNPMMHVTDIHAAASIAKKHGLLLLMDNTFLTPYFQTPILPGADVVIHSGTKYLCGHNDVPAGFLIPATKQLAESLGGAETLLTCPATQTHADIPQPEREAGGISNCLLRLSVGLESVKDIIEDLEQALQEEEC